MTTTNSVIKQQRQSLNVSTNNHELKNAEKTEVIS